MIKSNWAELDLNQRSITQRIYNPPPLTTRAPTLFGRIVTNKTKENNRIINYSIVFFSFICYYSIRKSIVWVINSAVECLPYKQKVTGSNPVLPIFIKIKINNILNFENKKKILNLGLSSNGLGQKPSKFPM